MNKRTAWLIAGLGAAASILLSLWLKGLFLFLFLPFLTIPFFVNHVRVCPECGRETMHPAERYCAVDGAKLERK
ncbi:MAG: hypothetical protein ACPHK8_03235 [Thermoplasmatota archaeon]